jgi:hypothetical protein
VPATRDVSAAERSANDMTFNRIAALVVLVAVVGVLIHGKVRSEVAALTSAASLMLLGVIRRPKCRERSPAPRS